MDWLLEVVEVRRRPLLRGVSFAAAPAAVTAVCGGTPDTGAMLFRLLLGMERPDRGAVLVLGTDISRARARARERVTRRIGVVFGGPDFALFGAADAHENIALAVRAAGRARAREADAVAARTLARLGLDAVADFHPGELPEEARRRLAVGRALALGAPLVVADLRDAPRQELATLLSWLLADRDERGTGAVVLTAEAAGLGDRVDQVVDLDEAPGAMRVEVGEPSLRELVEADPLLARRMAP